MDILFVAVALLVLSLLVLVHELGHFIVAKFSGVWVEEFGVGLPPRVFGKKIGETVYSVNALPFGGFVRLHGESTDVGASKPERAFYGKSKKARIAVALAGVVMNLVFAVAAFATINFFVGVPRETGEVKIIDVAESSPAEQSGLTSGGIIEKVDGQEIVRAVEFVDAVSAVAGPEVALVVDGEEFIVEVRETPPPGEGAIGVVISSRDQYFPPLWQRPFLFLFEGIRQTWGMAAFMLAGFAAIFSEVGRGGAPQGLAGPVGITALLVEVARLGAIPLLEMAAFISINLALLNLIPFPPLDGSRVVLVTSELLLGKKKRAKVEGILNTGGMAILITLLVLLTIREVPALLSAGSISAFVDTLLQ